MQSIDDEAEGRAHAKAQLERMAFFSDAVFAIAMTLLVIEVKLPHVERFDDLSLANALLSLIPSYVGFLISFLVLARFWVSHHVVLGALRATNVRLLWANLLLLLAVAFMPFPTAVVAEFAQLRVGVGFYSAWLVLLGLLNQRIIRIGIADPDLHDPRSGADTLRPLLRASWIPIVIGSLAFAAGIAFPFAGLAVLAIGSPIISYILRRR
jgi:uncharacterized membrane protein